MRPHLGYHKRASLSQSTQSQCSSGDAMVWPFTFDWCLLFPRELVRFVIRTPCCRVLVHKTCLYASLAISPSQPRLTCPHCQQDLDLGLFRRLYWRLSGKWSPWFERPLAPVPPYTHSYHEVYLQIMDPPPPPSSGHPDDDDRVSGTHWLNSSLAPVTLLFLPSPLTPLFHILPFSFHLGTTTTFTTTTPRRQANAGKCLFVRSRGRDVGP